MPSPVSVDRALTAAREGAIVLTAGRRLARMLRREFDRTALASKAEVWESPEILPLQSWISLLWEEALYAGERPAALVRLDPELERLVWEQVIRESPEGSEFIQIRPTAEAVQGAWALMKQWQIAPAAVAAAGNDDSLAFLGWARSFQARCKERGWVEDAAILDSLSPQLKSIPLPNSLFLAGFDEFTPQQQKFLDACRAAGIEIHEVEASAGAAQTAVRIGLAGATEEIAAAARWARTILEDEPAATIGVVFPNLEEIRRKVERVFADIFAAATLLPASSGDCAAFNISAGLPIAKYPVIQAALLALKLDVDGNDIGLVSSLVRSSYLGGAAAEFSRRGLLDACMRDIGDARVSVARIRRLCAEMHCPELAGFLEKWQAVRSRLPEKTRPAEWSRAFSRLLALLGWPGGRSLNSAEYQTVQAWMDLLSGFARLDAVAGEWTCPEALFELERLALETMFQPEGKDAPVQILGLLEVSGLHFDHLWIAGLHDEAWPAPARPAPFLPASLQRAQDLPHSSPARELKYAAQMTNKLLSSAASVVVSYPLNEGERKLGPSPLVRHLPASPVPEMEYDRTLVEEIRRSSRTETLAQDPAPPVSGGAWQRGGSRVFEFQSICPFRAFAELRLASKKIESPQDGLSARDRGILVHAAFEKAWMELGSQAELLRRSGEELAGLVRQVVASALQELEEKKEAILPRLRNLEQKRIEALLADWLEKEKERPPFSVLTQEMAEYVDFAGIRCKVVLDRVDKLEADGRQVIIDYKTGKASPNSWTGSRPDQPQLPFYAVLREANLAAVLFAHIKTGESRFQGYADDGVNIPGAKTVDIREELAQWRTTLERLAAEFRAGEAAVDPKNTATACPSCPFPALCRIAELEAAAPSSGEDNDE